MRGCSSPFAVLAGIAALLVAALSWASPAAAQVLLVMSETGGAYEETAEAFRSELRRLAPQQTVVTTTVKDLTALGEHVLVVTLGSQAARSVAAQGQRPPTIHSLLPRAAYERIPGLREGRDSAVLLDQPASRQIELVRQALPGFNRLALLEGRESRDLVSRLADAARERKLIVVRETVQESSDLYAALQRVTAEPAVLLATPDSGVFNSYSIQNVLLTAYRQHSPVVGFSAAYVRAGAVLGLYSTPTQIGRQTAEMARVVLAGASLPPPQGPRYFEVGSNPQVARSLGIVLEEPEVLRARLLKHEGPTQ
jgi:ABC-type uncharacterized transport system substrate-binding protein